MGAPRRAPGDVSAGWIFLLCLAAFLFVIVDVPSIFMTDEELAEAEWRTIVNIAGFWGGIGGMIYFGRQWRLERRVVHGESREELTAEQALREEVVALSHSTGVRGSQIVRELRERGITTADWAREHGIDPTTWRRAR
jgi:hypothetical protein